MKLRSTSLSAFALGLFMAWSALPVGAAGPAASAPVAETKWEELVPKDWDPMKRFRDANVSALSDSSPKVMQMMREMREALDNAPTNSKMDGASVRLPGYVVPLDEVDGQMKEFLLVPYFGACIHTPPPPSNQIVHVVVDKPMQGYRTMDAVWVTGTLKATRLDTAMGTSGYRIQPVSVERYVEPPRR